MPTVLAVADDKHKAYGGASHKEHCHRRRRASHEPPSTLGQVLRSACKAKHEHEQ